MTTLDNEERELVLLALGYFADMAHSVVVNGDHPTVSKRSCRHVEAKMRTLIASIEQDIEDEKEGSANG